MVDQEMLEAMSQMMDRKLEPINAELRELKQGQAEMRGDIADLNQKVTKIKVAQENITNKTLSLIQEGIAGVNEQFHRLDVVEKDVENHDDRIFALEQLSIK